MTLLQEQLLSLLKTGLFNAPIDYSIFANCYWTEIYELGKIQAVIGVMLDGMNSLPLSLLPERQMIKRLAMAVNRIEEKNREHIKVIYKIQSELSLHNIPVIFMKGQTCGARYPNPKHRMPGDIDFIVKEEDFYRCLDVLDSFSNVNRGLVHEHHGMAHIDDIVLEPHYKVHNYQCPSSDKAMIDMFRKEIDSNNFFCALEEDNNVRVFSPTFESVFLISHMVNHIYEEGLGLRQLCDYAMFLHKNVVTNSTIMWDKHTEYLKKMGMERSWKIFTCACIDYLGLQLPALPSPHYQLTGKDHKMARRLIEDIMRVGNFGRGEYVFKYNTQWDVLQNYLWVTRRCINMGFVCPREAAWWPLSKFTRFFGKKIGTVGK